MLRDIPSFSAILVLATPPDETTDEPLPNPAPDIRFLSDPETNPRTRRQLFPPASFRPAPSAQ